MSARKPLARTPTNTTINSGFKPRKKFVSKSNESLLSTTTTTTVERLHFKRNLLPPTPIIDNDTLYDIAYNEYLNNVLLKNITNVELNRQKEDLQFQLMYRMDNYQKLKKTCRNYEKQINGIENYQQLDRKLGEIEEVMDCFEQIGGNGELCKRLEDWLKLLESLNSKLYFENVKPIKSQEDYEKLLDLIDSCANFIQKFTNSRDLVGMNELARNIEKLELIEQQIKVKQDSIGQEIYEQVYELLKTMSDIFATKKNV